MAFLRYGTVEGGNPCAANVRHAHAFGASQSGRYLREFLYLGLNEDEQQRPVFDGLLVHIAGGKRGGDFNQRFGQPSSSSRMSDLFPFHDTAQTDPATGRTDGLLDRLAACNRLPKVFFTNSSTEYWRGDASLIHTSAEGEQDLASAAAVCFALRCYNWIGGRRGKKILRQAAIRVSPTARRSRRKSWLDCLRRYRAWAFRRVHRA